MGVSDGKTVVAKNFGRVMLGVEADAQQVSAGKGRIRAELLVDFREIAAHARAEIRERAARVDKGDEQNTAAKLLERNSLAVLIGKGEVRNFLARCRQVKRTGCSGGRVSVANYFYVLKPVIGRHFGIRIVLHHHLGRN